MYTIILNSKLEYNYYSIFKKKLKQITFSGKYKLYINISAFPFSLYDNLLIGIEKVFYIRSYPIKGKKRKKYFNRHLFKYCS